MEVPDFADDERIDQETADRIEDAIDAIRDVTTEDREYALDVEDLPDDMEVGRDYNDLPYVVHGTKPWADDIAVGYEYRAFCPTCNVYFGVDNADDAAEAFEAHEDHMADVIRRKSDEWAERDDVDEYPREVGDCELVAGKYVRVGVKFNGRRGHFREEGVDNAAPIYDAFESVVIPTSGNDVKVGVQYRGEDIWVENVLEIEPDHGNDPNTASDGAGGSA